MSTLTTAPASIRRVFLANEGEVLSRHVAFPDSFVERARRLALGLPSVTDARGHRRIPTPADAIREAVARGLAAMEAEFDG